MKTVSRDAPSLDDILLKLVVLGKSVRALQTFIKNRLSFIRAPQLHGVKVQPPMGALGTLFIHRGALARDLFSRAHLRSVRISRLDAMTEPKLPRSRGEHALLLPERCSSFARRRRRQRRTRARSLRIARLASHPPSLSIPLINRSYRISSSLSLSARSHLHLTCVLSRSPSTPPRRLARASAGTCRTASRIRARASASSCRCVRSRE